MTTKQKIEIDYIESNTKRQVSLCKRKKGLFKKAQELCALTGSEILMIVVGEKGAISEFASDKLKILIDETREKIQQLLELKKMEIELEEHLGGGMGPTGSPSGNTELPIPFLHNPIFNFYDPPDDNPDSSIPSRSY